MGESVALCGTPSTLGGPYHVNHINYGHFLSILKRHASDVPHLKHIILFVDVTPFNDAVTSYVTSQHCTCRASDYLRLKGIKRFKEEGENIMSRLVSEEERTLPQDIDFKTILSYKDRQRLYERRLKLTKALPIMQQGMCQLENKNKDKISLYITQKSEFTAGLHMLIDKINGILRKDDEWQQLVGLQTLKALKFYPSGVDLWAEMPVDIIRKVAEEHEECMMSIDDARSRKQLKHIGMGKMSKGSDKIPSITSAFWRVQPSASEGCKALPLLKESGCQEVIVMAVRFQNPDKGEQAQGTVIQQSSNDNMSAITSATNEMQTENSLIEERQHKRKQVLEQFL